MSVEVMKFDRKTTLFGCKIIRPLSKTCGWVKKDFFFLPVLN